MPIAARSASGRPSGSRERRSSRRHDRLAIMLAGLLSVGLSACQKTVRPYAETPEVSLAGMSYAGFGASRQTAAIQLRLTNPNDFDIPVERLTFDLEVNGKPFAHGLTAQAFTLPAAAAIVVPVDIAIATDDLIDRVAEFGAGRRLGYLLSGQADIDFWFAEPVVFSREGRFALPLPPDLSLDRETDG